MNIRAEESSFKILVMQLCRLNKVAYAIDTMKSMIDYEFSIDDEMCSCILSAFCVQGGLGNVDIVEFWEELRKLGFSPGMGDYTNVIRFLVKRGRGMDALNVLYQMKSDRVKPSIVCYNYVLRGVIAEGDFELADDLFDELLVYGLVPDVYTYNAYIDGLCKQSNVEQGLKMITCMEELGCRPNLITYNILLKALCDVGEMSRVRELVKEMEIKGMELNVQTYRILIDAMVSKGEIPEACGLVEEVLDKCFVPESLVLDNVVCDLCQRGLVCKALELLSKMISKSVSPGDGVWKALLSGSKLDFAGTTFIDLVGPER